MNNMIEVKYDELEYNNIKFIYDNKTWKILTYNEALDAFYVISENIVHVMNYHSKEEKVSWEQCDLRHWLNNEYYDSLSENLKNHIIEVNNDKITCLSLNDYYKYLNSKTLRSAKVDESISDLFPYVHIWWLSTKNEEEKNGHAIFESGDKAENITKPFIGVRPCFYIKSSLLNMDKKKKSFVLPQYEIVENTIKDILVPIDHMIVPEGIKNIGDSAFENEVIQSITFPQSLESIADNAFKKCFGVKEVYGNTASLYNVKEGELLNVKMMGRHLSIPEGVKVIKTHAISSNNLIESITFPSSLRKVEDEAIIGCFQLKEIISYSDSIEYGLKPFEECEHLRIGKELLLNKKKLPVEWNAYIYGEPEVIAYTFMYQKTKIWKDAAFVNTNNMNASIVFDHMFKLTKYNRKLITKLKEYLGLFPFSIRDRHFKLYKELTNEELIKEDMTDIGNDFILSNKEMVKVVKDNVVCIDNVFYRILDIQNNIALFISEHVVGTHIWKRRYLSAEYKDSDIHKDLNDAYYMSLPDMLRNAIIEKDNDKVFLLSKKDVNTYFNDEFDCCSRALLKGDNYYYWWLSSKDALGQIEYVDGNGEVRSTNQCTMNLGIRPAFYVDLSKLDCIVNNAIESYTTVIRKHHLYHYFGDKTVFKMPANVLEVMPLAFNNRNHLKEIVVEYNTPHMTQISFNNCLNLKLNLFEYYKKFKNIPVDLLIYLPENDDTSHHLKETIKTLKEEEALRIALCLSMYINDSDYSEIIDYFKTESYKTWLTHELKVKAHNKYMFSQEVYGALKARKINYAHIPLKINDEKMIEGLPTYSDFIIDYGMIYDKSIEPVLLYENKEEPMVISKVEIENNHTIHQFLYECSIKMMNTYPKAWVNSYLGVYAQFASKEEIKELIKLAKDIKNDGSLDRKTLKTFNGYILLNDTIDTIIYADSKNWISQYAMMHDCDEQTVYLNLLQKLELDMNGNHLFKDKRMINVNYHNEQYEIMDVLNGNTLKTMPRCFDKEFRELKRDIQNIIKCFKKKSFIDFLENEYYDINYFKYCYQQHPVTKIYGKSLVWEQGSVTFIMDESEDFIDMNGNLYHLTDEPIHLAHPMEITEQEINSWQQYFRTHHISQPIMQMWEPVIDKEIITTERYNNCIIPMKALMHKELEGIRISQFSECEFRDCDIYAEMLMNDDYNDTSYMIVEVNTSTLYTRYSNHIYALIDKLTVKDRIIKDDPTIERWLSSFTLSEIDECVEIALKHDCVNVSALLLNYKNKQFKVNNPMDMFTLDEL